jgi:hypothetical protein
MKAALCIFVISVAGVRAQVPVEVLGGNKKMTLDIMFFKYFKTKSAENSRFLFFNRNRVSLDYRMNTHTHLPQFGFTEAVSYNHSSLKGFAPVLVGQVFGSGFYPKAGVQLFRTTANVTVFSWIVSEIAQDPSLDYFLLLRYTPQLTEALRIYTQLESVNTFPTQGRNVFSLTQRLRVGLNIRAWQGGFGVDLNQTGRGTLAGTTNAGIFLRIQF